MRLELHRGVPWQRSAKQCNTSTPLRVRSSRRAVPHIFTADAQRASAARMALTTTLGVKL
jgi:hypothetical protein